MTAVLILIAKLLIAPACVAAVSVAGRRWGTSIAGLLAGLPVVGGPILLAFALVHGDAFAAQAAAACLLGLAALAAYVVVYGLLAERYGGITAIVLTGWAAFMVAVAFLSLIPLPEPPTLISAGASLALVVVLFRWGLRLLPAPSAPVTVETVLPWWDLPGRALAALALVFTLTAVSGALGPDLSGLLAPFPVMTSVLAIFTHAQGGRDEVRIILRGFLNGFNAYAVFCFVLAVTLTHISTALAFLLALAVSIAVQSAVAAYKAWAAPRVGVPSYLSTRSDRSPQR